MADHERRGADGAGERAPEAEGESAGVQGPLQSLVARFGPAVAQRIIQRRRAQRRTAGPDGEAASDGQAMPAADGQVMPEADGAATREAATHGLGGAGGPLPHRDAIQRAFGRHDVSQIVAHTDGAAAEGAAAMGAEAFASGQQIAFAGAPSLHTAAHEAAHVVQQRGGVQLKGGVGQSGDAYERHADAVADRVVAGAPAEDLLAHAPGGGAADARAVQKRGKNDDAPAGHAAAEYSVTRKVNADKTPLVADPSRPKAAPVALLGRGDYVTLLELGAGEKFNTGVAPARQWWRVKVLFSDKDDSRVDKEGWVSAAQLTSNVKTTREGATHTDKVGDGQVTVATDVDVAGNPEPGGMEVGIAGTGLMSVGYEGKDAGHMRWLQFIWRELIIVDDKGRSQAQSGALSAEDTGDTLAQGGTKDKFGTPTKDDLKVDSSSTADPFYEASGTADRAPDATRILDKPGVPREAVKAAFKGGAKMVVTRAHTHDFLVKDEKTVVYQTGVDIEWRYTSAAEMEAKPQGKQTVAASGAASALPATMAARLHEQYPAYKDIK